MIRTYFPFVDWLFHYDRSNLRGDVLAGLTVAITIIPQSMAIAQLANLPPIIGLYASVFPVMVYALFGTSRNLAIGPAALISVLVASGINELALPGGERFIALAILLAGMVGVIQFGMGLFRFGFLVNFLSHPVISGFTSAAAVIIAFTQLPILLGIGASPSHHILEILVWTAQSLNRIHPPTLAIGVTSLLVLAALKQWKETFPRALLMVGISAFLVWSAHLEKNGVAIMGVVPRGLRGFVFPRFTIADLRNLLPIALAISLIAFVESVAIAKSLAAREHNEVNANQELVGLGLANIAACFFGAYPVTGGFSRSAINVQAGARTQLASIVTAATIAMTLLFLTDYFYYLPTATLAAIVIISVTSLIDLKEVQYLYRVKGTDLISLVVTFFATLTLGIEKGLLLSIATSLILIVKRTTRPHYAILGRLPGTKVYRNVERYPEAITLLGLIMIRIDASLYFANVNFLKELIGDLVSQYKYKLSAVIFDASSINDIDSPANKALQEISEDLGHRKIKFYLTNVKGPVRDVFKRSGFYEKLGESHFFYSNHDAVKHFLDEKFEVSYETPGNVRKTTIVPHGSA